MHLWIEECGRPAYLSDGRGEQVGDTVCSWVLAGVSGRAAAEAFFADYLGAEALEPAEDGSGTQLQLVRSEVAGERQIRAV
jgi:hypothetical protein